MERGGEEEMMRTIWLMEERRRMARQREMFGGEEEEEEYLSLDEIMAEEVGVDEERELGALLGLMGEPRGHEQQMPPEEEMGNLLWGGISNSRVRDSPARQEPLETPYGSDDDEYDHIFMDVIQEETRMASQQEQSQQAEAEADHDMMDMS